MELLVEIARVYGPKLVPAERSESINPATQVIVTYGASQAISLACTALLSANDEVVLLEPAFDVYRNAVRLADATPVYVPLHMDDACAYASHNGQGDVHADSAHVRLDVEEFASKLSERTRMVILNSPHNPTGKVFTRAEYEAIAEAIDRRAPGCVVLSDEVYEHLVYDAAEHVPFANVSASAFARTLSVYSVGKTFSATGWKVGWVVGPSALVDEMKIVQQISVFCVNHMTQIAFAKALRRADNPYQGFPSYYAWLLHAYRGKRDVLLEAVRRAGLIPIVPQGAFYICAFVPASHEASRVVDRMPDAVAAFAERGDLVVDKWTLQRRDYNVCRNLIVQRGVTAIPVSAFFGEEQRDDGQCVVRFAFCHTDELLRLAGERLVVSNEAEEAS